LEARLLAGFARGGGPERALADRDEILTDDQAEVLSMALKQRCARAPMAHILGRREFWSLNFTVTPATLTPRPDSETIVETALDHVPREPATVLDLGTGTGCLLLALLSEWPDAQGVGVDASEEALDVAVQNADALGMAARARMVRADWQDADWTVELGGPFDVVVSNPPYIPAEDIAGLDPDVRVFEPMGALDGGADGLDAYRRITAALPDLLRAGGLMVFEVGIGQDADVAALLTEVGFTVLERRADLGGVARAVAGRKP